LKIRSARGIISSQKWDETVGLYFRRSTTRETPGILDKKRSIQFTEANKENKERVKRRGFHRR